MTVFQEKIINEINKGIHRQVEIAENLKTTQATISKNIDILFKRNILKKQEGKYIIIPESEHYFYIENNDESGTYRVKRKIVKKIEEMGYKNLNEYLVETINNYKK